MFAKDRLMEQSDQTKMWVCKLCGLPALVTKGDYKKRIPPRKECTVCETNQVAEIILPHATKLLMQEQAGMNVFIRVLPTPYGNKATVVKGEGGEGGGEEIIGEGTIVE